MQIESYTNPKYLRNTGNTTRVRQKENLPCRTTRRVV